MQPAHPPPAREQRRAGVPVLKRVLRCLRASLQTPASKELLSNGVCTSDLSFALKARLWNCTAVPKMSPYLFALAAGDISQHQPAQGGTRRRLQAAPTPTPAPAAPTVRRVQRRGRDAAHAHHTRVPRKRCLPPPPPAVPFPAQPCPRLPAPPSLLQPAEKATRVAAWEPNVRVYTVGREQTKDQLAVAYTTAAAALKFYANRLGIRLGGCRLWWCCLWCLCRWWLVLLLLLLLLLHSCCRCRWSAVCGMQPVGRAWRRSQTTGNLCSDSRLGLPCHLTIHNQECDAS